MWKETEAERQERHRREHNAALLLQEQMLLDERPGERLIRAMFPFNQASGFRAHTFVRAEVESVAGIEPDSAAIMLRSGTEIPVSLPYAELEQKIFRPDLKVDGLVLDLCEVTGETAKPKARSRPPHL